MNKLYQQNCINKIVSTKFINKIYQHIFINKIYQHIFINKFFPHNLLTFFYSILVSVSSFQQEFIHFIQAERKKNQQKGHALPVPPKPS